VKFDLEYDTNRRSTRNTGCFISSHIRLRFIEMSFHQEKCFCSLITAFVFVRKRVFAQHTCAQIPLLEDSYTRSLSGNANQSADPAAAVVVAERSVTVCTPWHADNADNTLAGCCVCSGASGETMQNGCR